MLLDGSSDSAAAIATISVPPKAKMTISRAPAMPAIPVGKKPPLSTRLETPAAGCPGMSPKIARAPTTRNAMIANTLIAANQYSKRP